MSDEIRVSALGVVRRHRAGETELLVERHRDAADGADASEADGTGGVFYRPLGGGVEFGERSEEALRREFREELGVELGEVSSLGTYEDVFTVDGETRHEVWRLYEADIADEWPYEERSFAATEPESDEQIECVWKPVGGLGPGGETFYPEAVLSEL